MTAMPPRSVLSKHLEERIQGRRLLAAAFFTYQLDPAFFEQDILPVFLDVPLSHDPKLKLVQLEDALRSVPYGVAVYYDQNGIVPGGGSGRLDIRRIAICHKTGIFHPKNVFALVEEKVPDEEGICAQALIVASMSANLTRTGWWENVEVCHVEEIAENDFTALRDDLRHFLESTERRAGVKSSDNHATLRAIRTFLGESSQRTRRSTDGQLHTHFYDKRTSFVDFLARVGGRSFREMNLEIISPYFDQVAESLPLYDLLEKFSPRETRVYLPRNDAGEALCSESVFDAVRTTENVNWGRLPAEMLQYGKSDGAKSRGVHAKVYRFFQLSPRREVLFVGSVNLTTPAHQNGGNIETGFLVERDTVERPDWWLALDSARPTTFKHHSEDQGAASSGGTCLTLCYCWNTEQGKAFWDSSSPSPMLTVKWQTEELFVLNNLPAREWQELEPDASASLKRVLQSTSLLTVTGEREEAGHVLVQEEGMHARPSLLFDLLPAEILRYWSLLTPAQRAVFLSARAPDLAQADEGAGLIAKTERHLNTESFFDRFAGIFLAFSCLDRSVRNALPANKREAAYRLFGQKYDSLPNLLRKVLKNTAEGSGDLIEHYVTALCARQLTSELEREHPDLFQEYRAEAEVLNRLIAESCAAKERLIESDQARMPDFLDWFERWFLQRAQLSEANAS